MASLLNLLFTPRYCRQALSSFNTLSICIYRKNRREFICIYRISKRLIHSHESCLVWNALKGCLQFYLPTLDSFSGNFPVPAAIFLISLSKSICHWQNLVSLLIKEKNFLHSYNCDLKYIFRLLRIYLKCLMSPAIPSIGHKWLLRHWSRSLRSAGSQSPGAKAASCSRGFLKCFSQSEGNSNIRVSTHTISIFIWSFTLPFLYIMIAWVLTTSVRSANLPSKEYTSLKVMLYSFWEAATQIKIQIKQKIAIISNEWIRYL